MAAQNNLRFLRAEGRGLSSRKGPIPGSPTCPQRKSKQTVPEVGGAQKKMEAHDGYQLCKSCSTDASRRNRSRFPAPTQMRNSAGGYSWEADDWTRFDRFLILGAEGGTYYIGERDLVKQNHDAIVRCIKADGIRAVNRIVEVSDSGRAPKNDPAIFALALVATHGNVGAKAPGLPEPEQGLSHRHAPVPLRRVCECHARLGPWPAQCRRPLVCQTARLMIWRGRP